MNQPTDYTFVERPLNELSEWEITELQAVIDYWWRGHAAADNLRRGLYLNDHLNLRELAATHYNGRPIGRVFYLKDDERVLAYTLSFDTLAFEGRGGDFMRLVEPFVRPDVSFLRNVLYLDPVAFIFHLCSAPDSSGKYGRALLNHAMNWLRARAIKLVVSTLDSGQHGVLTILEEERPNMIFLNHEFSEENPEEIRLRVAELFNRETFLRWINAEHLPNSYDFVIPMQLNIATESINRMLEQTGLNAKILWTSFFHNVNDLRRLSGMRQFYQGFYQPIRLRDNSEEHLRERERRLQTLRRVSLYLKDKHDERNGSSVASLIPSMEKKGEGAFEFFFLNDDPERHDFTHFVNPIIYDVNAAGNVGDWLRSDELFDQGEPLTKKQKNEWYQALAKKVRLEKVLPDDSAGRRREREYRERLWDGWVQKLLLTPEQAEQLLTMQRRGSTSTKSESSLINSINNKQLYTEEVRRKWQAWFALHQELYRSDLGLSNDGGANFWWCHAVVPISYSRGITGVMFTFICEKPAHPAGEKSLLVSSLADTIANSLSRNMLNIVNKLYLSNFKTALSRFKTAALSARNLSHNVGSHVLSFLSQPSVLTKLIWQGVKNQVTPPSPENFERFEGIKDLANFFDFTKVRMSLLADMATNEPVASTPEWLKAGVLATFKQQNILKQFVKGNSEKRVKVEFYNLDAEPGHEQTTDVLVQIPNGSLGLSAFLMIMVNYLRNSIKYAPYGKKRRIHLILTVRSVLRSKKKNDETQVRSHRLLELTLHDKVPRKRKDAEEAVRYINRNFIKRIHVEGDEFNLAQEGLGFAEMVAAARYLRKRPFGNSWINTVHQDLAFLEAITISDPLTDAVYLGIRFYLKRPRPLLIIDRATAWKEHARRREQLNNLGIKLRFEDQLFDWELESFAHELAVVLVDELPDNLRSARAFTPRVVYAPADRRAALRKRFQRAEIIDLINQSWDDWLALLRIRDGDADAVATGWRRIDETTREPAGSRVFDDHGRWRKNRPKTEPDGAPFDFYEFYRSETPTGLIMDHLHRDNSSISPGLTEDERAQEYRLRCLLEEATRTRVVIVDERIQKMLKDHRFGKEIGWTGTDAFAYLAGMGVWVPDARHPDHPDFDDPATFDAEKEKLERYLRRFQTEHRVDFIVIHIGLIETIIRSTRDGRIEAWIEEHLPENGTTEYVIISGRGKPLNIPKRFRYLPYNNVSLAVLKDCPSKYHICQNLYNARTRS